MLTLLVEEVVFVLDFSSCQFNKSYFDNNQTYVVLQAIRMGLHRIALRLISNLI